jgi:type II secretory pathway pseudopilin PulG
MKRDHDAAGFTIVELAITMSIAMVVMASVLGVLVSQSNAERRVSDFADNQELMRQAIVALQRDIRSAEPLEELPATIERPASTSYALQVRLNVYEDITAAAVPIQWRVDTGTGQLVRELLDAQENVVAVTHRVNRVANSYAAGNHLFEFYSTTSAPNSFDLATTNPDDVAQCTVRIRINLRAAPSGRGNPILLTSDAQLRNRLPGGIGCTNI